MSRGNACWDRVSAHAVLWDPLQPPESQDRNCCARVARQRERDGDPVLTVDTHRSCVFMCVCESVCGFVFVSTTQTCSIKICECNGEKKTEMPNVLYFEWGVPTMIGIYGRCVFVCVCV